MMIKQYCPHNEVQKLEVKLWNHMVKGVDITTYNRRFQELAILCPAMVPTIEKLLERYVWGLPQPIQGNVTSFDLATIDEAMRMARRLMDQVVRAGTVLVHDNNHNRNHNNNNPNTNNNNNNNNKRRWNDNRRGDNNNPNNQNRNINHHNQQNHRQENARGYATVVAALVGGRGYAGNLPLCNRCKLHHTGPCTIKCTNCQKVGHQTKDYRGKGPATGANTQPILTCFGCGEHGHFKNQCPQNNGQQQQGGARGKVYVLGDKNAQQDPNVVTGMFLLNNHYAKTLFYSGADKSFVSTTFVSLLNITPTTLDTAFTIELANGKNPISAISDETIANPKARIVRDDMVRVQVPRFMAWSNYNEHVDSLSTMDNEVGVTSPENTIQTLPSFEEYTPLVTYSEEVEKTLGTPIEVEPLDKTQLEDLGLDTCNHDIPLSNREFLSFDEPEPQPNPN
ncbi:reverse transcriptase domain-containing protein [Tanacetum coccineum]